jgi:hypothetical protein
MNLSLNLNYSNSHTSKDYPNKSKNRQSCHLLNSFSNPIAPKIQYLSLTDQDLQLHELCPQKYSF